MLKIYLISIILRRDIKARLRLFSHTMNNGGGSRILMILIVTTIAVPFLGTAIGALTSLFSKKEIAKSKLLIGFAAGVMIAASIWSLLLPSLEITAMRGDIEFVPAAIGFIFGIGLLILLDAFALSAENKRSKMLAIAVTVHNVPEGMAVGAAVAAALFGAELSIAAALSLSIGVALQNIPEGAIVSLPLMSDKKSKLRAFGIGVLSGAVEPISALLTVMLYVATSAILPYMLSLAAGAMFYVAIKELAPEIKSGNKGMIGFTLGFIIMMIMDVCL